MTNQNKFPSSDNPEEALAAVVALRLMADKLERETVIKAISQGWTWAQVADALDVTRQAAHKKHAKYITKTQVKNNETLQTT